MFTCPNFKNNVSYLKRIKMSYTTLDSDPRKQNLMAQNQPMLPKIFHPRAGHTLLK